MPPTSLCASLSPSKAGGCTKPHGSELAGALSILLVGSQAAPLVFRVSCGPGHCAACLGCPNSFAVGDSGVRDPVLVVLGQIQPQAEARQHWPARHSWDLLSESCPVPQCQQLHALSVQPRRLLSKISCFWQCSAGLWLPALLRRGPWAASPNLCLLAASCLATQHPPSPLLAPGMTPADSTGFICSGPIPRFPLALGFFPQLTGARGRQRG